MTDKDTVRSELEWKGERYNKKRETLEQNDLKGGPSVHVHARVADTALSVGICKLLLGEDDPSKWFHESAEFQLKKMDKVVEYMEQIEGSHKINQPTYAKDALNRSILAGEDKFISEAIEKTTGIDQDWIHNEAPERSHVLYYALALASYLEGNEKKAQKHLNELRSLDHGYTWYEGREKVLRGLIENDVSLLHEGIETVLGAHQDYHSNPDAAVAFLSIDAMVYLKLAKREGLPVDRERFPSELREYLPEELPTEK